MPLFKRGVRRSLMAGALLSALALPACDDDDDDPTATTPPSTAAPANMPEGIFLLRCAADPVEGFAPFSVRFNPEVIPPGDTGLTYLWSFGDGATSAQARPEHVYAEPGTRTVRLTATRAGTTATCTTTVYVYGALSATCRSQPLGGTSAHFRVLPSFCFADQCRYSWDFGGAGGGTGLSGPRPDFTYSTGGTYTATATVTTGGQTASCRTTVTVP